jgi:hypothetical protein
MKCGWGNEQPPPGVLLDPVCEVRGAIVPVRLGGGIGNDVFLQERQLMSAVDHNEDASASPVKTGAALGCGRNSQ